MPAALRHRSLALVVITLVIAAWSDRGLGQESEGSLPDMMGDNFDGGVLDIGFAPIIVEFQATGRLLMNSTGGTVLALERDGSGFPNDLFADPSSVPGVYIINDEPLPPSEVPTSPSPIFEFVPGTAIYTEIPNPVPPVGQDGLYDVVYSYRQRDNVLIPSGGGGVGVRRIKISENNNPIPRDRILSNFNFFNDARPGFGDVSRYTFGFEKTYFNKNMSFEFRIPMAATLDASQSLNALGARNSEFGNAVVIFKTLLWRSQTRILTAGSGFALPTASSASLFMNDLKILQIGNDSAHVLPFLAGAWMPNNRYFAQGFLQFDFDAVGNQVRGEIPDLANLPTTPQRLPDLGVIKDASFLFVDVGFGTWWYQNPDARCLKALSSVIEFHYTSTLKNADTLREGGFVIGNPTRNVDILNINLATHSLLRNGWEVSGGFILPVRRGSDQAFDYEFALQVDRVF